MSIKKDRVKNKQRIVAIILAVCLIAVAGYCIYVNIDNSAKSARDKVKLEQLQEQYEEVSRENDELKAILDQEDKSDYIEQKAREQGYVKEGEQVFYDIS